MKKKKMLSLLLAAALTVSIVGCGSGGSSSTTQGGDSAGTEKSEQASSGNEESASSDASSGERVPLRWLTTGDTAAEVIKADDRIVEEINNRLGIDLTVEIVPEGNTEKVNVAMASGDFPDIVTGAYGSSATQQWIDDGMVIGMNDYMDANPALKEQLK